jgi:hypothetical protein
VRILHFTLYNCGNDGFPLPVSTLTKKHARAQAGLKESEADLDAMTKTADPSKITKWRAQADKASKDRSHNVEAMDIYNTRDQKGSSPQIHFKSISSIHQHTGPTKASLEVKLIEEEQRSGHLRGVTSWLATGLKIEETQ